MQITARATIDKDFRGVMQQRLRAERFDGYICCSTFDYAVQG